MPIPKYAVIACPKCRIHSQIVEYGTSTTKCQNCGAALKINKLRILYTSDILKDAVSARTQLQARMHGKCVNNYLPEMGFIDERDISKTDYKYKNKDKDKNKDKNKNRPKRNAQKTIIDIIRSADGALEIEVLKMRALDHGIDTDRFEKILEGLLRMGEIYSPDIGYVRLV